MVTTVEIYTKIQDTEFLIFQEILSDDDKGRYLRHLFFELEFEDVFLTLDYLMTKGSMLFEDYRKLKEFEPVAKDSYKIRRIADMFGLEDADIEVVESVGHRSSRLCGYLNHLTTQLDNISRIMEINNESNVFYARYGSIGENVDNIR